MTKDELLAKLERENEQFEALLDEVGAARMEQPGVAGEWSMKDVVAHLTGWRRRTVARLEAARRGEDPPPPFWPAHLHGDDEINAWMHERDKNLTVADVRAQSRQVFEQLATAVAALPEAELRDPNRFPWLEGEALIGADLFGHFHDEHEADMRAWLAGQEGSTA
jgi:hypothetical protein